MFFVTYLTENTHIIMIYRKKIFIYAVLCFLFIFNVSNLYSREIIPLNSEWKFRKVIPAESLQVEKMDLQALEWESVSIPHTWNNIDMQTAHRNYYTGDALYLQSYTPAIALKDKRIFLKFEGVGSVANVYVNKKLAGNHKGGYSAFVLEISNLLKFDEENEIVVVVSNKSRADVIPINHHLFGVYGGIYRPVQLIITEKINITLSDFGSPGVFISQKDVSENSAKIDIQVKLDNKYKDNQHVRLENSIFKHNGDLQLRHSTNEILNPSGTKTFTHSLTINQPHLWQGLDDPYLYKVVTRLIADNKVIDEVIQPLGVRTIEVKAAEGVYLNGKKIPMYGVCRHQDWWGIGSALDNKHHDTDLEIIKEIGATTIRLAHYQQSEYFYSRCDSIGFLVWAEIPFVNKVSTEEAGNARQQLTELIRQNYNHPSIFVWGLHNEVYEPYNYTANLTNELHNLAKDEDPYRYTVSVNGYGNIENPSNSYADIQGINRYFGWYEKTIQDLKPWIQHLEENYPNHAVILAEYGAEGNIEQQVETVEDFGDCCGPTKNYNETFQTKFHEMQWGYISDHPYLIASYLWNTFDFATPESFQGGIPARNMKGLVTFDRKIKKDAFFWYKANWSKEPVLYITQRRVTERVNEITPISIYSNSGIPTLTVNNKVVKNYKKGSTDIHYIFENIKLKRGKNTIKAVINVDGKKFEDNVIWDYQHGRIVKKSDIEERKEEHIGL